MTLLGLVGPAEAGGSLECFAEVPGMTARGVPATFHYESGAASTIKRGPGRLGYQPRDVAFPHHADGLAAATKSYWFTLSGSQLREVTEIDRRDAQGNLVSSDYHTRVVGKHWEGARQISIGRNRAYLYVLTNTDQLVRYRLRGKDGETAARYDQVVGTGFGTIGTFGYSRTITALGARIDVFLATDADTGALLEFAIPQGRTHDVRPPGAGRQRLVGLPRHRADGVVPEPEERAHVRRDRRGRHHGCGPALDRR